MSPAAAIRAGVVRSGEQDEPPRCRADRAAVSSRAAVPGKAAEPRSRAHNTLDTRAVSKDTIWHRVVSAAVAVAAVASCGCGGARDVAVAATAAATSASEVTRAEVNSGHVDAPA